MTVWTMLAPLARYFAVGTSSGVRQVGAVGSPPSVSAVALAALEASEQGACAAVESEAGTDTESSPSSPSSVARVGETWARLFGVAPEKVGAVGEAYERRIRERSVWSAQGTWHGAPAIIARLDDVHILATATGYHLVEHDAPAGTGIRRRRGLRWPLSFDQAEAMFEHAADHIARVHALMPVRRFGVHMTSFASWARSMSESLARADLVMALGAVMSSKEANSLYMDAGPKASRSYWAARHPFYMNQIGAALRALRSMMTPEVQAALWGIGVPDFRLANWLMESETHRLYRRQALRTQPLLLPFALLGKPHEEDARASALAQARIPAESGTTPELPNGPDAARRLLAAIDAGRPWFDELHSFLAWRGSVRISLENIRWLAGRSPRFLSWSRHGGSALKTSLGNTLDVVTALPGNRRPTTWKAWKVFDAIMSSLRSSEFSPSFLKGMPCEWTDDAWADVGERLSTSYADAITWATGRHYGSDESGRIWQWLVRHATLTQVLNFTTVAHQLREDVQTAMRNEPDVAHEVTVSWDGALVGGAIDNGERVIVELTTASDLYDEGQRLKHCVADYAYDCVSGQSRIFSVRTATGKPCSTFELYLHSDGNKSLQLGVAQHRAFKDRVPAEACKKALATFLNEIRFGRIQVNMYWPRGMLPEDRRRGEFYNRVRTVVSAELFRRWPALQNIIKHDESYALDFAYAEEDFH